MWLFLGIALVWSHREYSLAEIPTFGKTTFLASSIEVYDVVLYKNLLITLYNQGETPFVNIVRLIEPARTNPKGLQKGASVKKDESKTNIEAVQTPYPNRVLEKSGPLDGVTSGKILGPTEDGNVTVQLGHAVQNKDKSERRTFYHLIHDAEGQEFWTPDSSNIYLGGERSGMSEIPLHHRLTGTPSSKDSNQH